MKYNITMGISNYTLTRIFNKIQNQIINSKIERIINISDNSYIFSCFKEGYCFDLLLSLDPSLPIILKSDNSKTYSLNQSNYATNMLKKYFDHGTIKEIEKKQNDRIIIFTIKKWTQTYQLIETKLIFELFPLSPNIIITDTDFNIIDAIKKSISLDSKHLIYKGIKYIFPQTTDKYFDESTKKEDLKGKISKSEYRFLESLDEIQYKKELHSLLNEQNFYIYKNDVSSLKINESAIKISLEELFNILKDQKTFENKENKYNHIFKLVEQKIKSLNKKLHNLDLDQERFNNSYEYLEKGNLLYSTDLNYKKGDNQIIINDIKIDLDPKYNLTENAQKYFKLYKKSKSGIEQVKIQKQKTLDELSYFELINNQLKFANSNDIQEIILDLTEHNYIKHNKVQKQVKNKPSNKKYQPHFIKLENGTKIGYGLSSYQNEELTFSLAHQNDYYLHIKDFHGPHIIIFSTNPSEEELLIAGELAIYFANKTTGEVNYTTKKYVKKVPNNRGLTILKEYKTMVIKQIRESTIKLISQY